MGRRRPFRPVINRNHPLARGLLFAYFPENGSLFRELVRGQYHLDQAGPNTQELISSPEGLVYPLTTDDTGIYGTLLPDQEITVPVTQIVGCTRKGVVDSNAGIGIISYDDPNVAPFVAFGFTVEATNSIRFSANDGTNLFHGTSQSMPLDEYRVWAARFESGDSRLFENGLQRSTDSTSIPSTAYGTDPRIVIGELATATRTPNVEISHWCMWDRALSDAEIALASEESTRWDLFTPEPKIFALGMPDPTVVTSTVGPGKDYTSLSAWESAQQADLVALNQIRQAECYSFQDTTAVTINGWTTGASNYIRVYTPTAERHDGGAWDTSAYRLDVTDAHAIVTSEEYVRFEGLQSRSTAPTAAGRAALFLQAGATSDIRIESCILYGHESATHWQYVVFDNASTQTIKCWNSLIYSNGGHASTELCRVQGASTVADFYSTTFVGGGSVGSGLRRVAGTVVAKNCYAGGASTDYNGTITTTTCHDSDGSADTTTALTTANFVNVSSGTEDYHLTDESALRGVGTDTSGDSAPLNFTDDIDGDARSTTAANWHVGADHGALATITKTVKSAGGDYTSLSGWESGQQADLVSLNQIRQAECYSFQDTTLVVISTWTTDATRYPRVYTPTAERHDGTYSTGKYRIETSGDDIGIDVWEAYTRLEGLQLQYTHTTVGAGGRGILFREGGSHLSHCIVQGVLSSTASPQSGVEFNTADSTPSSMWNCIVFGWVNSTNDIASVMTVSTMVLGIYSSTVIGGYNGIRRFGGTVTAKNCYAGGNSNSDYLGTITKTTCHDSDGTGDTTTALTTANFVNVTASTEDYHLTDESALRGVGTDTSGDSAPLNFTDDIDGDARSTTAANWHVGADHGALATITKTVKSAAGDYTSLSGWESGQQADIESLNQIREAECYSFKDTTQAQISGWTTAAANYIRVYTPTAERHDGTWSTGKYYLSVTDASALRMDSAHIRVEGLQIESTAPTAVDRRVIDSGGAGNVRIEACIAKGHNSGTHYQSGLSVGGANDTVECWNTIFFNFAGISLCEIASLSASTSSLTCYSVSGFGGNYGIVKTSGTLTAKNCYWGGANTSDFWSVDTMVTCASSDTSGSSGLQSIALSTANFVNVTAGTEDYHLVPGSALRGVGTDTHADESEPLNFTDDIDGQRRSGHLRVT